MTRRNRRHALRAFEVNAVDYLLKPFGRERLAEALVRVRERLRAAAAGGAPAGPAAAQLAAAARAPGRFADRILIRDGAQVHVLPVERVDLLQGGREVPVSRSGYARLREMM